MSCDEHLEFKEIAINNAYDLLRFVGFSSGTVR